MRNTVPIPLVWLDYLKKQPETGMGYQVVSVQLKDGRKFRQVVAQDGFFTQVRGYRDMPFTDPEDVAAVEVNHKRRNFREE